ncbi:hypothetical protein I3760_07G124700 [Carya illinoinensis]|nr:hypothetical protein I3760_07G124700 [Carya illinoinensis]
MDNWHRCYPDASNQTANASYASDLTALLDSLSDKASQNISFYNDTSNGIYGLFLCRGDVSNDTCHSCVRYASQNIASQCSSDTNAIIWFDQCMLRYSDNNFFGKEQTFPRLLMWNIENVTSPEETNFGILSLMTRLMGEALKTDRLFKADSMQDESGIGYGLVQCTRDINDSSCNSCLNELRKASELCCQEKKGWRILGPSCNIRFENYSFFVQQPSATVPSQPEPGKGGKNTTMIVISSISSIAVVAALLGLWYYLSRARRKRQEEGETSEIILLQNSKGSTSVHTMDRSMHAGDHDNSGEMHYYSLDTIQIATDNFSDANKLGEGGFGPVYKGQLISGKEIAVKRLSMKSKQGLEEFKNEVMLIVKLQHRNLVGLLGCCLEGDEKLLVYEYMANTSLDAFLFDPKKCRELDWARRKNIVNGIARGLLYLHEDSRLKIIHRDLKASNVLLDDEMNPKISDFGTARMFGGNQIEANTNRVVGTFGYMAPEYAMEGLFSIKSDVYSFGVLMLEIVSGKKNSGFYHPERAQSLLSHTWQLWNEGKGQELIDQTLVDTCPVTEALRLIHISLLCVQEDPNIRPPMSMVVLMLGSKTINLPPPSAPPFTIGRLLTTSDQSTTTVTGTGISISDQSSTGPPTVLPNQEIVNWSTAFPAT